MRKRLFPVVITGHVDHGKSTLIGRLLHDTGTLKEDRYREIVESSRQLGRDTEFSFVLDAFREERENEITMDTSQICFQTDKREYLFIDAPGHKEFLRNMITGASYAEAAVLIIDAGEGVRDQTMRHVYLLNMLGVREICVLINKMDLVNYSRAVYEDVVNQIRAFSSSLPAELTAFVPISALKGVNITRNDPVVGWYHGPCFFDTLDQFSDRDMDERPFRFPVQDVYVRNGESIVAGRIESGEVVEGMGLLLLPERKSCTVKEIRKYMVEGVKNALYGDSIGLIVDGGSKITRGNILSGTDDARITRTVEAHMFWFYDVYNRKDAITMRCSTQETACTIEIHEKFDPATMDRKTEGPDHLEVGEVATATIRTERPVVIDSFRYIPEMGRFIIEKDGIPVAGGIVL
jgi:sulfate adenylyltransferase subunit 1